MAGERFKCLISTERGFVYSPESTLRFVSTWNGNVNKIWNNPANWSCGIVPDGYTDVIIGALSLNYPEVSANISVRSLTIKQGSMVSVKPGFMITIVK
jgi:hypothetical protein